MGANAPMEPPADPISTTVATTNYMAFRFRGGGLSLEWVGRLELEYANNSKVDPIELVARKVKVKACASTDHIELRVIPQARGSKETGGLLSTAGSL